MELVDLSRLLDESQDLVIAAALTDETLGLVGPAALARLRDGATVVNVARGGIVDLPALTREVRSGRLRCALDVTDPHEPLPLRHPLRRMRGAVVTPHVGAAQSAVRHAMAETNGVSVAVDAHRPANVDINGEAFDGPVEGGGPGPVQPFGDPDTDDYHVEETPAA